NSARRDNTEAADCSPDYSGAVYVFEGAGAEPVDLNVNRDGINPLMVVPVTAQETGTLYEWTAAFLTEGQYTVTYSCQLDDNETDATTKLQCRHLEKVVAGDTPRAAPSRLPP